MIPTLPEMSLTVPTKDASLGVSVQLHWDADHCTGDVRVQAIFAPDKPDGKPLLMLSGARHQGEIEKFNGDCGETLLSTQEYRSDPKPATNIHFGLGDRKTFDINAYRDALGAGLKRARDMKVTRIVLDLDHIGVGKFEDERVCALDPYECGRATAEVAQMVHYEINHRKSAAAGYKAPTQLTHIDVSKRYMNHQEREAFERGLDDGAAVGRSVNIARNLVNEPANICTPTYLANFAAAVGAESGIEVELLDRKACEALGMGCFMAVASGSNQPPMLGRMSWNPPKAVPGIHLVVIGKAITFDAGGIQIKDGDGMTTMKCDMAGSAAVIAAMRAIAQLKVPVRVTALFGATENMTGGSAMKPLDVYTAMDGQTVEIMHTDAEGRLVLSDMICYARHLGATHIIDLATLTGACMVALGTDTAGLFSNDARLLSVYQRAATGVGEKTWELPVTDKHVELIKSKVADWKNLGPRWAGASTAAALLKVFARGTPWLHVDIAGPAYAGSPDGLNPTEGGTGYGVRAIVAVVEHVAKTKAKWLKRKKKGAK